MDRTPRTFAPLLLAFSCCILPTASLAADEPHRNLARPEERVASASNVRTNSPNAPASIRQGPAVRSFARAAALASMNWVLNPQSRLASVLALLARTQDGFQPFKTVTDDEVNAVMSAVKEGKKRGDDFLGYKLAPMRFLWDVAAAKFLDILDPDSVIIDPSWDEEKVIGVKANRLRYKSAFYGSWAYVLAGLVYSDKPLGQEARELLLGYQEPPPELLLTMPVAPAGVYPAPQAPAKTLPMAVAPAKTLPTAVAPTKTLPVAVRPPTAPSNGPQDSARPAGVSLAERR
jgi:hypothetical protein